MFQKCWLEDENQVSSTKIGSRNGIKSILIFLLIFKKTTKCFFPKLNLANSWGYPALHICIANPTNCWTFLHSYDNLFTQNYPKLPEMPPKLIFLLKLPKSTDKQIPQVPLKWPKITKTIGPKLPKMAPNGPTWPTTYPKQPNGRNWFKTSQNYSKLHKTAPNFPQWSQIVPKQHKLSGKCGAPIPAPIPEPRFHQSWLITGIFRGSGKQKHQIKGWNQYFFEIILLLLNFTRLAMSFDNKSSMFWFYL